MLSFFKPDSGLSSMRLCAFLVCASITLLIFALAIYILFNLFIGKTIEWSGISMLLASTTAPVSAALGIKAIQKRTENNNGNGHQHLDNGNGNTGAKA